MFDIGVFAYLRGLNFENNEELGKRAVSGREPVSSGLFCQILRLGFCLHYSAEKPFSETSISSNFSSGRGLLK